MLTFFQGLLAEKPFALSPSKPIRSCGLLRDENKDFSYIDAQKDFGFSLLSFEEGIGLELGI